MSKRNPKIQMKYINYETFHDKVNLIAKENMSNNKFSDQVESLK
jgi:hypothetical protein